MKLQLRNKMTPTEVRFSNLKNILYNGIIMIDLMLHTIYMIKKLSFI